jgi:hypothetical protein
MVAASRVLQEPLKQQHHNQLHGPSQRHLHLHDQIVNLRILMGMESGKLPVLSHFTQHVEYKHNTVQMQQVNHLIAAHAMVNTEHNAKGTRTAHDKSGGVAELTTKAATELGGTSKPAVAPKDATVGVGSNAKVEVAEKFA